MRRRSLAVLVGVIMVLGAGGIGFALFTATATITTNANAASFMLFLTPSVTGSTLSSTEGSCGVSASGSDVTLTVANLLPGDFCAFSVAITDVGTIGGSVAITGGTCSPISTVGCDVWAFVDDATSFPQAVSPAGNTATPYTLTITDTSPSFSVLTTFTVTFTGTPT